MIEKFLGPALEYAGKAFVNGVTSLSKAVVTHFTKHVTKYVYGGIIAAASGAAMLLESRLVIEKEKKKVLLSKPIATKRN